MAERTPPSDGTAGSSYGDAPAFLHQRKEPLLTRTIPVAGHLPRYRPAGASRDLIAGLTVAALALPSAMAFGELAGLTPVNGLYCLLGPMIAYALLGSSRQMIVGTEGTVATMVAAAVLPLAVAGSSRALELAGALALLVAGFFAAARLLRLGWLADYFSRPVLIGFIHGVAAVLVIGQLGKLLGIPVAARQPLSKLAEVIRELDQASLPTILLSAVALASVIGLRLVMPRLPGALLVVVAAIGLSYAFDFAAHGIAVVGPLRGGLPEITLPTPPLSDWLRLLPAAAGIFLVSFADEVLTARSFAGRHGQNVRVSQELLAMAAANAAAGFTQTFPAGASGSRTAVNDQMGARTQIAGLVASGTVILVLLFLTEPVQYLPQAVLGAVIVSAGIALVNPDAWRALAAVDRVEVAIAGVAAGCVVCFGVLQALVVAVGLSIIDAVRRSSRPYDAVLGWVPRLGRYADVSLHPRAQVTPGVVVYRLDDRLFFANARYVKGRVREAILAAPTQTSWLVFDAVAVSHVDSTGLEMLGTLARDLRRDGITLTVARLRRRLRDDFDTDGLTDTIGANRFYDTIEQAVAGFTGNGTPRPDAR